MNAYNRIAHTSKLRAKNIYTSTNIYTFLGSLCMTSAHFTDFWMGNVDGVKLKLPGCPRFYDPKLISLNDPTPTGEAL